MANLKLLHNVAIKREWKYIAANNVAKSHSL